MIAKIFFTFLFFVLVPVGVYGAVFTVDTADEVSLGEEFLVQVFIDTEGEVLNALSGYISTGGEKISLENLYDGESILSVWVDRPVFDAETGRVYFSGFTPGGFVGKQLIFSFVAKAKERGVFESLVLDAVALKNDGEGSSADTSSERKIVRINSDVSTSTVVFTDVFPPEVFLPTISQFVDMFEGKPFVSFATLDKTSGIDHYEYAYAFFMPNSSSWVETESPFELSSEGFSKRIFIKAVDRMGNERIVSIVGPTYYRTMLLWVIIIGIVLCVLFFTRRFFASRS